MLVREVVHEGDWEGAVLATDGVRITSNALMDIRGWIDGLHAAGSAGSVRRRKLHDDATVLAAERR